MVILVLYSLFILPETKGNTLDEIQVTLLNKKKSSRKTVIINT